MEIWGTESDAAKHEEVQYAYHKIWLSPMPICFLFFFSILCFLKAFKSCLGADGFIVSGLVQQLRQHAYAYDGEVRFVVSSHVKDSKAVRTKSWNVWFVAEKTGEIVASHCDCMAG